MADKVKIHTTVHRITLACNNFTDTVFWQLEGNWHHSVV